MALLTYKKDIHMIMIDHAIANQMIDVIQTASTVNIARMRLWGLWGTGV